MRYIYLKSYHIKDEHSSDPRFQAKEYRQVNTMGADDDMLRLETVMYVDLS